jgi:hypothetical protein
MCQRHLLQVLLSEYGLQQCRPLLFVWRSMMTEDIDEAGGLLQQMPGTLQRLVLTEQELPRNEPNMPLRLGLLSGTTPMMQHLAARLTPTNHVGIAGADIIHMGLRSTICSTIRCLLYAGSCLALLALMESCIAWWHGQMCQQLCIGGSVHAACPNFLQFLCRFSITAPASHSLAFACDGDLLQGLSISHPCQM